jgi:hypothetical protein
MTWGILCTCVISSAMIGAPAKGVRSLDDEPPGAEEPVVASKLDEAKPDAPPLDKKALVERLLNLNARDVSMAHSVATRLAELPPDEGFAILKENWPNIPGRFQRSLILSTWKVIRPYPRNWTTDEAVVAATRPRNHPRLLDALDLGMRDPSPYVQTATIGLVMGVSLQDFSEDFEAYQRWYQANRNKPVEAVVIESLKPFVLRTKNNKDANPEVLTKIVDRSALAICRLPDAKQLVTDSGYADLLADWIAMAAAERRQSPRTWLAYSSLKVVANLRMDEEYLKRVALPLLADDTDFNLRTRAVSLLGRKEFPWAVKALRELLERVTRRLMNDDLNGPDSHVSEIVYVARSLAMAEDASAVPAMITVISAVDNHEAIHFIGKLGLEGLTGVMQDDLHDGAWWRAWWEKNKEKYPKELREQKFPIRVRPPDEPEES